MQYRVTRHLTVVLASLAITLPGTAQEPVAEPREVQIGLLLTDLTEINDADQSFTADVFMVASWHDPDLADASDRVRTLGYDEVWHPTLLVYNRRSVTESLPRDVTVHPDGTVWYLQRFTGQFSSRMDLREFPRDQQEFFVWLVSPARVGAAVTLIPSESMAAFRTESLSISDWEVGEASLTAADFQVASGTPLNPGVKLSFSARRLVTYYTIQVVIPLIAVVMMAYAVFWVAPTVVPTRIGVVVTTMLTIIAYRFMLANHVPRLSYLTRLDWFMLGSTVLVILTLFTMAGTAYLVSLDKEAIVKRIDRVGRVLYPVCFVVYSAIVWWG